MIDRGTALLVDGQNMLMRATFAARHAQMSAHGVDTAPLVLFIGTLAKHIRIDSPTRLLVTWDGGTSAERRERLPSYKANRKTVPDEERARRADTDALVRQFCALAGVQMLQIRGVEADDLIAGAWANLTGTDADQIVILSSDHDFLQLVGANPHGVDTELVRLSSAGTQTDRWTEARMVDEHGYAPRYWPLVTALAGDTSDGVPGLPGIGPKRAVKLLEQTGWSWRQTVGNLGTNQGLTAETCRWVVDLRGGGRPLSPVTVPVWRPTEPGSALWEPLIEFLLGHELRSVYQRLVSGELWSDRDVPRVTEVLAQADPRVPG